MPAYIESPAFRYGRPDGDRAMRSERRESHALLLPAMLRACALQFDGVLVDVDRNSAARPLTVEELAEDMGRTRKCAHDCLADLRSMGLMAGTRQEKIPAPGGIEVSGVLRKLTRKFWTALGLYGLYVESVIWAATNGKLVLKRPFKFIRLERKAKKKVQAMAGGLCGLAPDAEETRKRNTQMFLEALKCRQRSPGECPGGKAEPEICALCRRFGM